MDCAKESERIWEIDFLRGTALILMIYFHFIFDMKEYFGYSVDYKNSINTIIGNISVILFILISGISCTLSCKNTQRGIQLLVIALFITLITCFYNPGFAIKFGILHLLGTCILFYTLLRRLNIYLLILLATIIIGLHPIISNFNVSHDYLFFIGVKSRTFSSLDYYPIVPWMGLFLYGNVLGRMVYSEKKSIFKSSMKENIITKVGRKTLIVYVLHQPLIFLALTVIKKLIA